MQLTRQIYLQMKIEQTSMSIPPVADLVAAGSTYDFSIPGAATVRAAVESALNGTIAALEPNIVGDGSTDGTGAAVVDPQAHAA